MTIYAICGAPTDKGLLQEIEQRVKELQTEYSPVRVVSVSHDVMVQSTGAFLWTALITCEVK